MDFSSLLLWRLLFYYSLDGTIRVSVFITQYSVTLAMQFVHIKNKSYIFKPMHKHTRNSDNLTSTCCRKKKKQNNTQHLNPLLENNKQISLPVTHSEVCFLILSDLCITFVSLCNGLFFVVDFFLLHSMWNVLEERKEERRNRVIFQTFSSSSSSSSCFFLESKDLFTDEASDVWFIMLAFPVAIVSNTQTFNCPWNRYMLNELTLFSSFQMKRVCLRREAFVRCIQNFSFFQSLIGLTVADAEQHKSKLIPSFGCVLLHWYLNSRVRITFLQGFLLFYLFPVEFWGEVKEENVHLFAAFFIYEWMGKTMTGRCQLNGISYKKS